MFANVHDSYLAGCEADLSGERLVLIIEPPNAPKFEIAFGGLVAYKLTTTLRPILEGIYEISALALAAGMAGHKRGIQGNRLAWAMGFKHRGREEVPWPAAFVRILRALFLWSRRMDTGRDGVEVSRRAPIAR